MLRPKPRRLQRLVPEPTETAMKAIEIYREVIFEDGFPVPNSYSLLPKVHVEGTARAAQRLLIAGRPADVDP